MTRKELYNICHDEAVAYANSEQWSKRTGEEKSFLIQGYLDAMMEARKSEITEKEKEYPKTYEECIGKLPINWDGKVEGYKCDLLTTFQKLLICRDVYWKIAGDEKGLRKPWEPDWGNPDHDSYPTITRCGGKIIRTTIYTHDCPFSFPTEEMRDAFYENFKSEIEICKELL